jgi:hypothetical protein
MNHPQGSYCPGQLQSNWATVLFLTVFNRGVANRSEGSQGHAKLTTPHTMSFHVFSVLRMRTGPFQVALLPRVPSGLRRLPCASPHVFYRPWDGGRTIIHDCSLWLAFDGRRISDIDEALWCRKVSCESWCTAYENMMSQKPAATAPKPTIIQS